MGEPKCLLERKRKIMLPLTNNHDDFFRVKSVVDFDLVGFFFKFFIQYLTKQTLNFYCNLTAILYSE